MTELLTLGLVWYIVFVFSSTCHEAAHALVAYKLGDATAYEGGQVSLDPLPHIRREPLGMIAVPIISFFLQGGNWMLGWASAPYNAMWASRYPKRAAWMALAGPVSNLLIMLFATVCIRAGIYGGYFYMPKSLSYHQMVGSYEPGAPEAVATILSILFIMNLVLFLFNLLPFPPLDGSALFPLFLGEKRGLKIVQALQSPGVTLIGLLIAWYSFGYIFRPLYLLVVNLILYPGANFGYKHG